MPAWLQPNGKINLDQLGPTKSYFDGMRDAKADQRADAALNMAQETHDMTKEEFGWKRDEHDKQQIINAGMQAAAQQGGYEGVIDYLEKMDPTRALDFTKAKLGLDQEMMKTDVMKARMPNEIAGAMAEGYGIIGKMGAALLQAKPEDRDSMYQQILPIVKTVNPNAPGSLNQDAVNMFMLGAFQALPQSQLFGANKVWSGAQSTLGKINADIETALSRGANPNDPALQALYDERSKASIGAAQAGVNLTNSQLKISQMTNKDNFYKDQNIYKNTEMFNNNLSKVSQPWIDFVQAQTSIQNALDVLKDDTNNPQAQGQLAYAIAKSIQKGVLTDQDLKIPTQGSAGIQSAINYIKQMASGQAVRLTATDIANLRLLNEGIVKSRYQQQLNIENMWKQSAEQYSDQLDASAIRWTSQIYKLPGTESPSEAQATMAVKQQAQQNQAPAAALQALQQNPNLLPQFVAKYGYNPMQGGQ